MIGTQILDNNEGIVINRVQDAEPFVEYAHAKRAAGETGSSDMKLAAEFPAVIVEKYLLDAGITFQQFLAEPSHAKRMMADPALSAFRIWAGKV